MSELPLTPPEQNRRNWERFVRRIRVVQTAVFHPKRLWRQIITWPVISFLIALGVGTAVGVLSVNPPLFQVAKLCFILSAIILWLKSAHWLVNSRAVRWERMILSFFIFGLSGMALVETWQWISRNEAKSLATVSTPGNVPSVRRLLLTPGTHPTPPGPACTGDSITPLVVEKGQIAVFLGDSIAITKGTGTVILNIDGENILGFRRATSEIYLDAILRDSPGQEIGRITGNVVTLGSPGYEALNPDAHNVAILDSKGRRILSVRYVNESAIVVSGTFFGKTDGPFIVSDGQSISIPGPDWSFGETCFSDFEGPLFRFGDKKEAFRVDETKPPEPSSAAAPKAALTMRFGQALAVYVADGDGTVFLIATEVRNTGEDSITSKWGAHYKSKTLDSPIRLWRAVKQPVRIPLTDEPRGAIEYYNTDSIVEKTAQSPTRRGAPIMGRLPLWVPGNRIAEFEAGEILIEVIAHDWQDRPFYGRFQPSGSQEVIVLPGEKVAPLPKERAPRKQDRPKHNDIFKRD